MINIESLVEITLKEPDDFLKVKETLTRIGVASKKSNTLFQSCHILHKQGKYYIVHFKELFMLDGKKLYIFFVCEADSSLKNVSFMISHFYQCFIGRVKDHRRYGLKTLYFKHQTTAKMRNA